MSCQKCVYKKYGCGGMFVCRDFTSNYRKICKKANGSAKCQACPKK